MAFNTPNNFSQPERTHILGIYFWRIVFCFIIAFAAALAVTHLNVEPSYQAEAEFQIIPVEVTNPYFSNTGSTQPLSLQAALLCERLLTSDNPDFKETIKIETARLGGIINLTSQADDREKAKQLLTTAADALRAEHAAGQNEQRQTLINQLQAKMTKLNRRQAPLELEITNHLDRLQIPTETQATILEEGLAAKTITTYLKNYQADFSAREKKLEAAIGKENQELERVKALLADPDKKEIHTEETIFVDIPEGQELRTKLIRLEKELRAYLKTSTELHPFVKNTRAEIVRVKAKLKAVGYEKKILKKISPNPKLLIWQEEAKKHLSAIIILKGEAEKLEKDHSKWNRYAADVPLRLTLTGRMQQLAEEQGLLAKPLALLNQGEPVVWSKLNNYSPARVTILKPKPDYQMALIYGAIAGLVLSFVLVRLCEHTDHSIKNASHAGRFFSTPILASIPQVKTKGLTRPPIGNKSRTGNALKLILTMAIIITITAIIISQYYDIHNLQQRVWDRIEQVLSFVDLENEPDQTVSGHNQEQQHQYLLGALDQPVEEEIR